MISLTEFKSEVFKLVKLFCCLISSASVNTEGARNLRDVYDDITKVPFSLTRHSDRFKSVKKSVR